MIGAVESFGGVGADLHRWLIWFQIFRKGNSKKQEKKIKPSP
jgi:hypothetical protein